MQYFTHQLHGSPKTIDEKELFHMRNGLYVLEKFKSQNQLLYQGKYWILVNVDAPYSGEHCMLIYIGKNECASSIIHISKEELCELEILLSTLANGLEEEHFDSIVKEEKDFIIGINVGLNPGKGRGQSVFRPHFHFSLQSRKYGDENGVVTEGMFDSELIHDKFAINDRNEGLLRKFAQRIESNSGKPFIIDSTFLSIDFPIDRGGLFELINNVTREVYFFLDETEYKPRFREFFEKSKIGLDEIGKVWKGTTQESQSSLLDYEKSKKIVGDFYSIGFSVAVIYHSNTGPFLRLRFSTRNNGGTIGSMESGGHSISRKIVENPILPCAASFTSKVANIIKKL